MEIKMSELLKVTAEAIVKAGKLGGQEIKIEDLYKHETVANQMAYSASTIKAALEMETRLKVELINDL